MALEMGAEERAEREDVDALRPRGRQHAAHERRREPLPLVGGLDLGVEQGKRRVAPPVLREADDVAVDGDCEPRGLGLVDHLGFHAAPTRPPA